MVTNYLREIYGHMEESIQAMAGRGWEEKTIIFVSSLPTTWTSHAIVEGFKEAIANAGFGSENPEKHAAEVELTEAEAAAVFTLKAAQVKFYDGDILLVCDAGGGTTDIGLFQVQRASDPLSLSQIHQVQGVGIGATLIDRAFMTLVKARLRAAPNAAASLPRDLPKRLAESLAFRSVKHAFGSRTGNHLTFYLPTTPDEQLIPSTFSDPSLGIENGRMIFSRAEIQSLFDRQIDGIMQKIDKQLKWMQETRGLDQVKYLVLSGGFGSSVYLRTQLENRYPRGSHPNTANMSIIRCKFPQLAVVKGLIMDKRQKLESGVSLLTVRVARRSYSVVCMEEYNPMIHIGEEVFTDPYISGKRWALNQIDWIIRKGDTVVVDTTKDRDFTRELRPGDPTRQWKTGIIVSDNEPSLLPRSLRQAGAQRFCSLDCSLSQVHQNDLEEYSKRCWQKGKHHFVARFTVKVIVSPADLKFELWFRGKKYSNVHEPVKVQWDTAGAQSRPVETEVVDSNIIRGWDVNRRI